MELTKRQYNLIKRMIEGDVFHTVANRGCPRASTKEINVLRQLGFPILTENDYTGDGPSVHWLDGEASRERAKELLESSHRTAR